MKSYILKLASKMQLKSVIITCIILVATTVAGNAQFFVQGNIGMMHQAGKRSYNDVSEDLPTTYAILFISKVGYRLNNVFAVGPNTLIQTISRKEMISDPDNPGKKIELVTNEFKTGH